MHVFFPSLLCWSHDIAKLEKSSHMFCGIHRDQELIEHKSTYVKLATLPEDIMWKMNYMSERKPRTVQG